MSEDTPLALRPLGTTELRISPIGLGLAALGRPGYINLGHGEDFAEGRSVEAMQRRAHDVLDAAWRLGVRYFDAARSYGQAEAFLARWLEDRGLDPVIGSKWGYTYTAGWRVEAEAHEIKDHSLAVLCRQWGESRSLLGSALDLYQIHSATLASGVLKNAAVLNELARIKAQGIRIGFTTSGPAQAETIERALAIEIDGRRLFDTVQATWNLLETSAGAALQAAHDAGLGVIVKEALANGRLTARNHAPADGAVRSALTSLADRHAATPDALAIAAVLSRPWVDLVLSGAASVGQLESNLQAVHLEAIWRDRDVDEFRQTPEAYWRTRAGLAWN
ncbi:MAG: aldo/keto reductase [Chromatiales bacterium]|jgi:aryl-alcohol dehydrogenase-like predicted oxidoreductase